jgi:hypothetical protein
METVRRCKQHNVTISRSKTLNPCEIQATAAADMESSILGCYIAYVGVTGRCFGTVYRSHLQGSSWTVWPLKIRSIIIIIIIIIIFNLRTAAFKAYCAIWVRRSNFHHQASPSMSPRESTQRRKVELWARNVREFCLNVDFHVTFRDLLHAVKLRHGTDAFTSPPKDGVLMIFSPKKPDGFGRVQTRELGYRKPANYLQTIKAAKLEGWSIPKRR